MKNTNNLQRFLDAQSTDYAIALSEIKNGRKRSHWIWYIFPQIQGLGFSSTSKYYAIADRNEANAYMAHPVLGQRLIDICRTLLSLSSNNATSIFGYPDDMKLKSCITLFASLPGANHVFDDVLKKFFDGKKDETTMRILGKEDETLD